MKYYEIYQEKLQAKTPDHVFHYLQTTLKPSIKSWDFFVNWHKVSLNVSAYEQEFDLLSTLVGKENIEQEACDLFTKYPYLIRVLPILLATRENNISILTDYAEKFSYQHFDFYFITPQEAVFFLKKTGFLELLSQRKIRSLYDYLLGIEVGLESNARKNRTGTIMEDIIEQNIHKMCQTYGWHYMTQATQAKIWQKWHKHIDVDKACRQIDFAIDTPTKLFLIECNFYECGGSKLKSTAGEYQKDFQQWTQSGHEFIWITDGGGWHTAIKALRETFDATHHLLNLDMIEQDVLPNIMLDSCHACH